MFLFYEENQSSYYFHELHLLVPCNSNLTNYLEEKNVTIICDEVASSVKNFSHDDLMRHRRQGVIDGWHSFAGKGVRRMKDEQNHADYN